MDEETLPYGPDEETRTATGAAAEPERIGPYVLLRKIGEGGMGEVWEAQQEVPIRRRVALKLVKAGMDTQQVLARFESERQALALMDHPGIARVLDGGRTERGRPFFVMELVRGAPITDYCDHENLSIRRRIELFIDTCRAVQHAHQKGIIHRDLKPSNVLVATVDDRPVPKVIDFGVAKAVGGGLGPSEAVHTYYGQYVGTPGHMSPEQMESGAIDVDTRSDVYSLGILLYELLVGERPFVSRSGKRPSDDELRRKIREEAPPRPSLRLSGLGEQMETFAELRGTDGRSLRRRLRGDLDWIVLRALEKDRTRRYASASELAADLERHLANEPVSAGPPSVGYRARKFIARHRVGVAATATVFVLLVVSVIAVSLALVRAREAETEAHAETTRAEAVTDFLVDLFDVSDPAEAGGETLSARELLDRGATRITAGMDDQPLTQVRLLVTMGRVYLSLGLPDEAIPLAQRALELTDRQLDGDPMVRSDAIYLLSRAEHRRGNASAALELAERSLELRQSSLPPNSPVIAWSLDEVGFVLKDLGRYEEAMERFEAALEIHRAAMGQNEAGVAQALHNIGWMQHLLGRDDEALPRLEEAARIYRSQDPDGLDLSKVLRDQVFVLSARGEYEEARQPLEQALAIQERTLGPEHPDLAILLDAAGSLHWYAGEFDEAYRSYRRSLAIREAKLPPDHPFIASSVGNLGLVSRALGRLDEAERMMRRALDLERRRYGDDNINIALDCHNLGLLLLRLRKLAEAEPLLRKALELWQRNLPAEHPSIANGHLGVASLELARGHGAEALAAVERTVESLSAATDTSPDQLALPQITLAIAARFAGREERASTLLEEMRSDPRIMQAVFRPEVLMLSALSLLRDGKVEEASPLHDAALEAELHGAQGASLLYHGACFQALRGNRRRALDLLARANELGSYAVRPELDPYLASLRGDPEFEELVQRFREPWYRGDPDEEGNERPNTQHAETSTR